MEDRPDGSRCGSPGGLAECRCSWQAIGDALKMAAAPAGLQAGEVLLAVGEEAKRQFKDVQCRWYYRGMLQGSIHLKLQELRSYQAEKQAQYGNSSAVR